MPDDDKKIRVLMCDDDPADRSLVKQLLRMAPGYGFELMEVEDVSGLLEKLISESVDAIILDVHLPGRSGLESLGEINALNMAPVIVATGQGDEMIAVEAMKSGAFDYLPKLQFSASSLSRTVINAIERWNLERQVKAYRKELVLMARTDALTGILNRRSLMEALKQKFEGAAHVGGRLCLIMFDIDHFKDVNDTYGHDVGDGVLVGVCRSVETALGDGDVFGRYGGEEFMVLLSGKGLDEAVEAAGKYRKLVEGAHLLKSEGAATPLTISLGVAAFDGGPGSYEELIKQADMALYRAKEAGRNRVEVSSTDPSLRVSGR